MATHNCATDAELNTAIANSVGGDQIKLTVSRDYTMSLASGRTKASTVTISNADGINARLKAPSGGFTSSPTKGFYNCSNFTLSGIRIGNLYTFSCDDFRMEDCTHSGTFYVQGDCNRVTFDGCTWPGQAGKAVNIDGRISGSSLTPVDITVQGCTFSELGDDAVFILGGQNIIVQDCVMTDLSSYHFSGNQSSSRPHSDGIQCVQVDGLTIRRNRMTRVEWAGIIIQRQGHLYGYTGANTKLTNIVIENNIISRVGTSYCTVPTSIPGEATGGGTGIQLIACETVTVQHNTVERTQAASLNFYKQFPSGSENIDPNYTVSQMVIRAANNSLDWARNTSPSAGSGTEDGVITTWAGNYQSKSGQTGQYPSGTPSSEVGVTLTWDDFVGYVPKVGSAARDGGVESASGITLVATDINGATWEATRDSGAVSRTGAPPPGSGDITVRAVAGAAGSNFTTTHTIAIPSAAQVGDYLLVGMAWRADRTFTSLAGVSGLTQVGSESTANATFSTGVRVRVYAKKVESGDPGTTLTLTLSGGSWAALGCLVLIGQDVDTPLPDTPVNMTDTDGTATTKAITGITTTVDKSLVAMFVGGNNGAASTDTLNFTTVASGWTEQLDQAGIDRVCLGIYTREITPAGASGNMVATFEQSSRGTGLTLAVAPEPVGVAVTAYPAAAGLLLT